MVFSVEHIVLLTGDDNSTVIVVFREPNVHLEIIHDLADVLALGTYEAPVDARVDSHFFPELVVLKYYKIILSINSVRVSRALESQSNDSSSTFSIFFFTVYREHK